MIALVGVATLALSGCSLFPMPSKPQEAKPTSTAVESAEPSPQEPTPDVTPSSTTPAPPKTVKPTSPPVSKPGTTKPASKSINVSKYEYVEFASPSGRLVCGIFSDGAYCFLPPGFQGKVPSSAKACGDPTWM